MECIKLIIMKKNILCFCILFSIFSCKKNVETDNTAPLNKEEVTLRPNVFIMDSTVFRLNSDSVLIKQNKFEFILINNTIPTYKIGDIIVIATNDGYIQKIASITNSTGKIMYTTTNVSMDEVIEHGSFSFNMNSDSLRVVQRGYTQNFSNTTLSGNSQYSLRLISGNVTFDPDWKLDFDFKKTSGLNKFELSCANSVLNADFDLLFSASGNLNINSIDTLKKLTKTFTKNIPVVIPGIPLPIPFPVKVVMDVRLLVRSNLNVSGVFSRTVNISSNNTFGVGVKYENNQWNGIYNFTPVTNFRVKQTSGLLGYNYDFYLYPEISFKLYNVAGPYASVAVRSNINENMSISGDRDQNAYTWLQTTIGAKATILGRTLFDYSRMWNTDSLKYNAPFEIKRISGDGQIGQANQNLPLPIKVRILDSKGDSLSNVPVYFNVTSGGGSVSAVKVFTDINGYAETMWRIGSQSAMIQYLSVSAKKANGTLIKDAPLDFAASALASTASIVGRWKITGYGNNFGINYFSTSMPACEKDNVITYTFLNGIYKVELDEGVSKCNTGDPQTYAPKTLLSNPIIGNDINTYSGSRFGGNRVFELYDTPAVNITTLNQTTLQLMYEADTPANTFWTITYTRQ